MNSTFEIHFQLPNHIAPEITESGRNRPGPESGLHPEHGEWDVGFTHCSTTAANRSGEVSTLSGGAGIAHRRPKQEAVAESELRPFTPNYSELQYKFILIARSQEHRKLVISTTAMPVIQKFLADYSNSRISGDIIGTTLVHALASRGSTGLGNLYRSFQVGEAEGIQQIEPVSRYSQATTENGPSDHDAIPNQVRDKGTAHSQPSSDARTTEMASHSPDASPDGPRTDSESKHFHLNPPPLTLEGMLSSEVSERLSKSKSTESSGPGTKDLKALLDHSERYRRRLMDSSREAIVLVDPNMIILDVNNRMTELSDYSRSELVGSEFSQYFTDPGLCVESVRKTLDLGPASTTPLTLRSHRGHLTQVSTDTSVILDVSGHVIGSIASMHDCSERMDLLEQLKEAEGDSHCLIDASSHPIAIVNLELEIVDVNDAMAQLFGYDHRTIIGSRFDSHFCEPNRVEDFARGIIIRMEAGDSEAVICRKDGTLTSVNISLSVLYDLAGIPKGIMVTTRDNSQVRALEAALLEAQSYNRLLLESNVDALMTTDLLGRITDLNNQTEVLTGLTRKELVGRNFKDCFIDPKPAAEAIRRVLFERRLTDYELAMETPHGNVILSYCATTYSDSSGVMRGIFVSAHDITEQRRLKDELEARNIELRSQNERVLEANRHKSHFLASMSHELRTPLNSIIGFSDYLASQPNSRFSPEEKEFLEDIRNSGNHLLELINDVLDVSKIEAGKMDLHPEPFSPKEAIVEVCSAVKLMSGVKGLVVSSSVSPELGEVSIDPLRFKQILYNLLSNAVKFSMSDGRIEIRAESLDESWFRLEVVDTGIGISHENYPRLFQEFEQLESGSDPHYGGTGLGLVLTKRLVELHGGTIGVRSEVGQGTTVEVVLPAHLPLAHNNSWTPAVH